MNEVPRVERIAHRTILAMAIGLWLAQPVFAQTASVFTYFGMVRTASGEPFTLPGYRVVVRTQMLGQRLVGAVGDAEPAKYAIAVVDFTTNQAALVGDVAMVTLEDSTGREVGIQLSRTLSVQEITSGQIQIDMQLAPAGVLVEAPPAQNLDPGETATFVFTVTNLGSFADTYGIEVISDHPQWIDSYPTEVGLVPIGEMAGVAVTLTVPASHTTAGTERIRVRACSRTDPGVCAEEGIQTPVPVTLQASSVQYVAGRRDRAPHAAIAWRLAATWDGEATVQLMRRRNREAPYEPMAAIPATDTNGWWRVQDEGLEPGAWYEYALRIAGASPSVVVLGELEVPAAGLILYPNAPNPFNPRTRITIEIPSRVLAQLRIVDVTGHVVRNLVHAPLAGGLHQFEWDGRDDAGRQVGSGVYVARLETVLGVRSHRMILLK